MDWLFGIILGEALDLYNRLAEAGTVENPSSPCHGVCSHASVAEKPTSHDEALQTSYETYCRSVGYRGLKVEMRLFDIA